MLVRPRNAGLVDHAGEIVGAAEWPAIVPETLWRGVVAALTDPARRTQFSSVLRWMGSGLYRCHCGATVRAMANGGNRASGKSSYTCTVTKHLTRVAVEVDDFVTDVVIEWLDRQDPETLLTVDNSDDAAALDLQARALRARLDELAALYAANNLTASQLTTGSSLLRQQLGAIEGQIADLNRTSVLAGLIGQADTRAVWLDLDLDRRRAVISRLMTVVLLPGTRGRRPGWRPGESYFDPTTIRVDWKV